MAVRIPKPNVPGGYPGLDARGFTSGVHALAQLPAYNATHETMTKWILALNAVRAGVRDAKILCVGDSQTFGQGGTDSASPPRSSYPRHLTRSLAAVGVPTILGLGVPANAAVGITDARWTAPTGWQWLGLGAGGASSWQEAGNNGNALVFTPGPLVGCDRFDIYYLRTPDISGSIVATATGGSSVTQSTVGADGVGKFTVSASSLTTTNSVSMVRSGAQIWILGVEPWDSTTKRVRVGNAGVSSTATAGWLTQPFGRNFGGLALIDAYQPDLTIISLGTNDAVNGETSANYLANTQTLITRALLTGSVMLMTNPTGGFVNEQYALAAANNIPIFDYWKRNGSALNAAKMAGDNLHDNQIGLCDKAACLAQHLTSVGGPA